jgi:hypothetical protein
MADTDARQSRARKARFTGPGQYILWMLVFLAAVIAIAGAAARAADHRL